MSTIINGHEIAGRMPLFKPELRQANRDGRKSQTRRVFKSQPLDGSTVHGPEIYTPVAIDRHGMECEGKPIYGVYDETGEWGIKCPYRVGDIRVMCEPLKKLEAAFALYADDGVVVSKASTRLLRNGIYFAGTPLRWHWKLDTLSSMFMPYEAGRSLFRITDIRVERVQEISYENAIAEGLYREWDGTHWWYGKDATETELSKHPINAFRKLWDSINADRGYSWESNPWVWVYTYEAVE